MERVNLWIDRVRTRRRFQVALFFTGVVIALCLAVQLGLAMGRQPGSPLPLAPWNSDSAPAQQVEVLPPSRGTLGSVEAVEDGYIRVIDRRTGRPFTVRVRGETVIQRGRQQRISPKDLHVGDGIFVVGLPSEQGLDARFIGVVNPRPSGR